MRGSGGISGCGQSVRSAEYLAFLVANGYQLAEVERVILAASGEGVSVTAAGQHDSRRPATRRASNTRARRCGVYEIDHW
jgi:hypothetical protein